MHFLRTSTLLLAFIGLPCSLSGQALEKAPTVILDGVAFRVEVSARLEPVHVESGKSFDEIAARFDLDHQPRPG